MNVLENDDIERSRATLIRCLAWVFGAALLCCPWSCSNDESATPPGTVGTGGAGGSTSIGGGSSTGGSGGGGAGPACGGADAVQLALASLDCTHADVLCVDDTAGGSQEYSSIQACAAEVQPGQMCLVFAGTYDERVSPTTSGAADSYVSFVGHPGEQKPVMRGFDLSGRSYVRVVGFEITHDSLDHNHGIVASDVDHLEIFDNYIHHVQGHAIRWWGGTGNHVTIRGNEMFQTACPDGVVGSCSGNGWAVQMHEGDHILIEYNHAHRVGDFINIHTTQSIVRNNYLHDFDNDHWPDGPGDALHADMFQPTGVEEAPSNYQVYESNFMGDNVESNSHVLQMRSTFPGDHHIIFRGNVAYSHGSYAMQCGGIDNVYYFNNTIHQVNTLASWAAPACGYNEESGNFSVDNHNLNNLYSDIGDGPPLSIQPGGNACASSNNLCHLTGAHDSCYSTADPLFVDGAGRDFHLQAGSPAIDSGAALTTVTSAAGSGTSFEVADAGFFSDGFGVTPGDRIRVGESDPVTITAIDGSTITVDESITWSAGDGIFWRHQDTTPDVGAYDHRASGYQLAADLNHDDSDVLAAGVVTVSALVGEPELVRFVEFWIDGLPAGIDHEAPFVFCWDASDASPGSEHHLRIVARPLYASSELAAEDTATITIQ